MSGLVLSFSAAVGTIVLGTVMKKNGVGGTKRMFVVITAVSFMLLLAGAALSLMSAPASAAAEAPAEVLAADAAGNGLGFIGMALATGLACIGAGIAVGSVGSAALGLVGEKPDAIGTTLIYVGLAEGVAIYGIVISMLIFSKLA